MNEPMPAAGLARVTLRLSRDKSDALLLLGGALLVLVPHAAHLPLWISLLCGMTLLWRTTVTLRGTRMPPVLLLLPISVLAMAGVYASFGTLLGRDSGVAMLVLLVAFKMLEMHARRDLFVVIFLCLFLVLTNFFYSQSILTAVLMVASVIVLLSAQLSFQFTGAVPPLAQRLRLGASMVGLAAPLALLLFFGFPRIQGPLWGMPGDANQGRTGLSESMAPGNLSNLALSGEKAFSVRFAGAPPAQAQLYWRGVVLGDFDGRTWTRAAPQPRNQRQDIALTVNGAPVRHQVTLEPHGKHWLFALDLPNAVPSLQRNQASVTAEFELRASAPITTGISYQASSNPSYSLQALETLPDSARWLALPRSGNRLAMAAGLALQRESDPVKRINALLNQFRNDGFVYTLEPPLLGADSVDQFLYGTRAGFCEHYASSFVFLMRAANVPARVVTGYQGGETNPVDATLTVRQSDAHAWAEVWLAGRGWSRIDPTAAVAPNRILRSVASEPPRAGSFGLQQLGSLIAFEVGRNSWIAQLRHQVNAMNNQWDRWVVNYHPERQRSLLEQLSAALLNWTSAAGAVAVTGLLFLLRTLRRRRETDPVDEVYSLLCRQMASLGTRRAADEGPNAYARRISMMNLAPEKKAAITRFLQLYSAHKYAARPPDRALLATLKRLFNESR